MAGPVLHLALELDEKSGKLAFTRGLGQPPRLRQVRPRAVAAILREVETARERFGLSEETRVVRT